MSRTFRRSGQSIRAAFEPFEVELLQTAREELAQTLRQHDRHDPVIQRLFPPPVLGDAEVADEVQQLIEEDLLHDRLAGLNALIDVLERGQWRRSRLVVDLSDEEPVMVLGVLNDVRLAIGARIDVVALDRQSITEHDPVAYQLAVMDHLGWWQEQLLELL